MAGSGGNVQNTSTFQTSSLSIDREHPTSDVLEAVVKAGENFGYDFDENETGYGFLAVYGDKIESSIGKKSEALRVEYNEEESELYVQGATRSNITTSLASLVETELEK